MIGWLVVLLVIIALSRAFSRGSMSKLPSGAALVLQAFEIHDSVASEDSPVIEIAARSPGLTAWLFTLLGMDAKTVMSITLKQVLYLQCSLYGQISNLVPVHEICRVFGGYTRNISLLISGALLVLGGVVMSIYNSSSTLLILGVVIGIILMIAYVLEKKLSVFIETTGGSMMGLSFKRSVIENIPVDIEKVKSAINLLNYIVLQSKQK